MLRTARTFLLSAAFLLLASPLARAGDDLDREIERYEESHQDHTLALRPTFWYPVLDGEVAVDAGGGFATTLDTDDDFGLRDAEGTFGGEADLRFGDFDLWLAGFAFRRSGESTVTRSVEFGDITFTGSADLATDIDFSTIGPRLGWAVLGGDSGVRLGPTLGANWVSVDIDVEATTDMGTMRERVDESVVVPALGVRLEVPFGDFLLVADGQGMSVAFDTFDGTYADLSATLAWRPFRNLGVFLGYRYLRVDATWESDGEDYDIDLRLHGPIAGFELRF